MLVTFTVPRSMLSKNAHMVEQVTSDQDLNQLFGCVKRQ